MDARIEKREVILLAGMGFYGNPFVNASAWDGENEIGCLWKRFSSFLSAAPEAVPERADLCEFWYEVHVMSPEMARNGRYEVFAGVRVLSPAALSRLPPSLSGKALPAADYAVIALKGNEISGDWMARLYGEIVPGLGRRADESFSFQLYDSRFKGMDRISESELDYWIPLLPEAGE